MSSQQIRNFPCPATETACVDPRCKKNHCAQRDDEENRRRLTQAEEDKRFIKQYGELAWKIKQIKL
ncbi:MAG TPA: hypothetical protein VJX94_17785 [Stellaceae bacterium]|nr:hypothetical protein [Stellaceae bacterium]